MKVALWSKRSSVSWARGYVSIRMRDYDCSASQPATYYHRFKEIFFNQRSDPLTRV
jgi:hypothetical protein